MGLWNRLKQAFARPNDKSEGPAPAPSVEAAFRSQVAAIAERLSFVSGVREDPDDPWLLHLDTGGEGHVLFLGNVYRETRELDPESRLEHIHRFLSSAEPQPEVSSWDEAEESLAPVIRPITFGMGVGTPPLSRPFLPMLRELVVLDREHSMQYVSKDAVERWGASAERAFAAARSHLAECIDEAEIERFDPEADYAIWHVTREDDYQTSRLLLPGWLAAFASRVSGRPIAIIPERAQLVVSGDGDPRAVRRLAEMARAEFEASPRSISPAVYTVGDDGEVVPYVPAPDHPAAALVATGHEVLRISEYQGQKAVLDKIHENDDTDVFVASYTVITRKQGGMPLSYCTWTEGVDALLPEASTIMFNGPKNDGTDDFWGFGVPWSVVRELAPDHLKLDPELDPPRWRTVRWPDGELLAKLRERATL